MAAAPVWSGLWMGQERQLHNYGGRRLRTGSVIKEVSILSIIQASFSFRRIRDSKTDRKKTGMNPIWHWIEIGGSAVNSCFLM